MEAVLDLGAECAWIAGTRFEVAGAGGASVRVGGSAGTVLRPLRFGERSRAVRAAGSAACPPAAVAAAVLEAATVRAGGTCELVAEIVALLLAGADLEAPPFDETALAVARTGLGPAELLDAEAKLVDRMALTVVPERSGTGEWTSIRLVGPSEPVARGEDGLESARHELAQQLLDRSRVLGPQVGDEEGPKVREPTSAARSRRALEEEVWREAGRSAASPDAGVRDLPSTREIGDTVRVAEGHRARGGSALVARACANQGGGFTWRRPLSADALAALGALAADPSADPAGTAAGATTVRPEAPAVAATALTQGASAEPPAPADGAAEAPVSAQRAAIEPPDLAEGAFHLAGGALPLAGAARLAPPAVGLCPGDDGAPRDASAPGHARVDALASTPAAGAEGLSTNTTASAAAWGQAARTRQFAELPRASIGGPRRSVCPGGTDLPGAQPPAPWTGDRLSGPLAAPPVSADELAALLHDEADLRGVAR